MTVICITCLRVFEGYTLEDLSLTQVILGNVYNVLGNKNVFHRVFFFRLYRVTLTYLYKIDVCNES